MSFSMTKFQICVKSQFFFYFYQRIWFFFAFVFVFYSEGERYRAGWEWYSISTIFRCRMTLDRKTNPVYQPGLEDIHLEHMQTSVGQRAENYNEIIEPTVKYLKLIGIIIYITFFIHPLNAMKIRRPL